MNRPSRPSRIRRSVLLLLLVSTLTTIWSIGTAERAFASDNGQWSVFPTTPKGQLVQRAYFEPALSPGRTVRDSLTVKNLTDAEMTLDLYTADAYNTAEGGFALRTRDEPSPDIATWIELDETTVKLGPRKSVDVGVTITPPADAAPGDHAGGIVAINTESSDSTSGSVTVRAVHGVGVRVYGRIEGGLPSLEVQGLTVTTERGPKQLAGAPTSVDVTYKLVNTGSLRLEGIASDTTASPLLGSDQQLSTTVQELLPGSTIVVHEHFDSIQPAGLLGVDVAAKAEGVTAEASATKILIPWILVAILVAFIVWRVRRRRRRRRDNNLADSAADEAKVPATA